MFNRKKKKIEVLEAAVKLLQLKTKDAMEENEVLKKYNQDLLGCNKELLSQVETLKAQGKRHKKVCIGEGLFSKKKNKFKR